MDRLTQPDTFRPVSDEELRLSWEVHADELLEACTRAGDRPGLGGSSRPAAPSDAEQDGDLMALKMERTR
jgi:hypothetical protein